MQVCGCGRERLSPTPRDAELVEGLSGLEVTERTIAALIARLEG